MASELLRADIGCRGRSGVGADHANGEKNIQNAEPADRAAKRRVKQNSHQRGEVREEIVLLPDAGPREVKQDRAHHAAEHYEYRAQKPIHR